MYYFRSVYFGRTTLAIALDASCLLAASAITWITLRPRLSPEHYALATGVMIPLALIALFYADAYRPSVIGSPRETLKSVVNTMALAFVGALLLYFVIPVPRDVVPSLAYAAGLFFPLLIAQRAVSRLLWTVPSLTNRVVVIGASQLGREIAQALSERRNAGIELLGFLSDDLAYRGRGATFAGYPVLGQVHELEKVLAETTVDRIVVASKDRDEHFPVEALQAGKMSGCRVESGVAFFESVSGKIYLRDLRPSYLIFSEGFRMGPIASRIKRVIDIVGSSVALILAAPVLALAAIAIKLDSKGPVLFHQKRVGRGDALFTMVKLRSMRVDAERESGAVFTAERDPRVTRVGHFLRRTRIDEVPQLWNILRGDMSLVGPRAERPEFVECLAERYRYYRLRNSVKPGLTGWAQTRYGYVNDVDAYEEKLALDLYYLKHRSLMMDLFIMWQTVKTVLLFRGM